MSRHRDIKEAQAGLLRAAEEVIQYGYAIYSDDPQIYAWCHLDKAVKALKAALDTERLENAAVARDTSIKAAKTIRTGSQRFMVLETIVNHWLQSEGTDGLTADATMLRIPGGKHQSISARVSELEADGYIYDSKIRRKTSSGHDAIVWFPTGRGVGRVSES